MSQSDAAFVRWVRVVEMDEAGITNPAGLAFSPRANAFHIVDGQSQPSANTDVIKLTPFGERAGSARIAAAIRDPINMAFDSQFQRLLIFQSPANQLIEVREGLDGSLDPRTLIRHDARHFGVQNPQGMTVDPASGQLLILDSAVPRIVRIEPEADGTFDGAVISEVDLRPSGLGAVRGLAFDPATDHLYVFSPAEQKLYELTQDGQVVAMRDLAAFGFRAPQAMVLAPSGDLTDDPAEMSLYLADSGLLDTRQVQAGGLLQNGEEGADSPSAAAFQLYLPLIEQGAGGDELVSSNPDTSEVNDPAPGEVNAAAQAPGQLVELSFSEPVAPAASSFVAALIRTVDLAAVSPPSPDPSGLTYVGVRNTLVMVDGEVEETVSGITHFQGANVWEFTLAGSVMRTANISKRAPTVVPMTDEPTGVAWDPVFGGFFVTDDGTKRVYRLKPGPDGWIGTGDDTWTSFDTRPAGNLDPEGIAYDATGNRLFVADGVNEEVYVYTPEGALLGQFDVTRYGVIDPESVEYNPDRGTLFVMSSHRQNRIIVETTTDGTLLQTIDIAAANSRKAAGLAYAPASNGSGAKRLYVVDRGIDNNSDPKIIDGKMYELSAPSAGMSTGTPTATPTHTPTNPPTTNTPTPTNTPDSPDLIFADGFESGNLSAWSASKTDGGDLSVSAAAALVGSNGMQALIDDNKTIFVTDDTPNAEPRYRARFYFDPNSISMVNGDAHFIFNGLTSASTAVLRVEFRRSAGNYQVRGRLLNDGSTWTNASWFTISDAPHFIELDWRAATAAGANNGGLTLWIDGLQQANLTGVDNDTRRIDRIRLGAVVGIDTGTRGSYYFDAFESRRQTAIGPASSGAGILSAAPAPGLDALSATNEPVTILSAPVQPGTASDLAGTLDGLQISLSLPAHAVSEPGTVVVTSIEDTTLPDGYALLGSMFDVRITTSTGVSVARLLQPFSLRVEYGDTVAARREPAAVSLHVWQADQESWALVPATVLPGSHTLNAHLSQPATVAVLRQEDVEQEERASYQLYLPAIQR